MNITQLRIENVTVDSIIERDGPWRMPADLFPAYDPEAGRRHFAEMDDFTFDPQSGRIVITYQTFALLLSLTIAFVDWPLTSMTKRAGAFATKSFRGIPDEYPSEGKSFAQVLQVRHKPITETTNSPIFIASPILR